MHKQACQSEVLQFGTARSAHRQNIAPGSCAIYKPNNAAPQHSYDAHTTGEASTHHALLARPTESSELDQVFPTGAVMSRYLAGLLSETSPVGVQTVGRSWSDYGLMEPEYQAPVRIIS